MNILIELKDESGHCRSASLGVSAQDSLETVAMNAATELGIHPSEVIEGLEANDVAFTQHDTVGDCIRHGHNWHCRRGKTCVQVYYQSEEPARHFFNPKLPWSTVHEWG